MTIYAVLVVARAPHLFLEPRFWAEEAFVYFAYARLHNAWDALTAAHMGYYSLWANLGGWLATLLPLHLAPVATLILSFAVQMLPAALLVSADEQVKDGGRLRAPLLLASLLFTVPTGEVWLNVINSQVYFAITVGIVAALPVSQGAQAWPRLLLLLVAGLASPAAVFVLPIFLGLIVVERSMGRALQAGALGAAGIVQALAVLGSEHQDRLFSMRPDVLFAFVLKQFFFLVSGHVPARHFAELSAVRMEQGIWSAGAISMALAVVCSMLALAWATPRTGRVLLASSVVLSVVISTMAMGNGPNLLTLFERYYTAPTLLLGLALVTAAFHQRHRIASKLAIVGVGCSILIGIAHFFTGRTTTGPSWADEVRQYYRDPADPIVIWPDIWVLRLSEPVSERGSWPTIDEVKRYGGRRLDGAH